MPLFPLRVPWGAEMSLSIQPIKYSDMQDTNMENSQLQHNNYTFCIIRLNWGVYSLYFTLFLAAKKQL